MGYGRIFKQWLAIGQLIHHPTGNHCVVVGGVTEGLGRQFFPRLQASITSPDDFKNDPVVVIGINNDGNKLPVFCRRPNVRRPADVDVLDAGLALEVVQVDDNEVDGTDVVLSNFLHVTLVVTNGERATKKPGVECFQTTIQHLWEVGNVFDWDAGYLQRRELLGGSACGNDLPAITDKDTKLFKAAFVGD